MVHIWKLRLREKKGLAEPRRGRGTAGVLRERPECQAGARPPPHGLAKAQRMPRRRSAFHLDRPANPRLSHLAHGVTLEEPFRQGDGDGALRPTSHVPRLGSGGDRI